MAIDRSAFRTRALTATVFALVMLGGLFINVWSFISLFTIIHFGCWYEFIRIAKRINPKHVLLYGLAGILYITVPVMAMIDLAVNKTTIGLSFAGAHFAAPAERFIFSPLLPIAVILSIWINDTMAYIVGSLIGKTPFSPISPKKTWEGTIGGIILCIAFMSVIGFLVPVASTVPVRHWIFIAAIASVTGTIGDLLESKLKRLAGLKDSGSFMPGHGGFLDRFDSLLIATPCVWVYVKLCMF